MGNSKIRNILGYIFSLFLMVLFLYLAFKDVNLETAFDYIKHISIPYFILFIAVFIFSHLIRALRWQIILNPIKKKISLLNLFGATMIGYGMNCVIPRAGEIYRPSFLGRWENLSRSAMFGTLIVERIIDLIFLFLAVLMSIAVYPGDLLIEFPWLGDTLILGFIILGMAVLFLFSIVKFQDKFSNLLLKYIGKFSSSIAKKLDRIFSTLVEGFSTIQSSKHLLIIILYTAIIMGVYGLNSLIGFYMLNLNEVKDVNYAIAWIVMTISAFGIVVPTPGGTGTYHFLGIASLGLFGFSEEIAGAYTVTTHLISTFIFIMSTLFFIWFINNRRNSEEKVTLLNVFKYKTD